MALRLRLCIRRNALPDTRIVFAAAVHDDTTVAQLLEQVDDVVPLESAAWGLDDYAVEVAGYECLHYQRVAALFEKDQEVVIRPRTSEEIKKQRLGGRRQITSDGRHLLDGVPFGRPLLKRPARPMVHIPPLKKRRIGELDDDDDDDDDNDALFEDRLQLEYPHDEDEDSEEDDDDDEDDGEYNEDASDSHSSGSDPSEDPDDELEALKQDQELHDMDIPPKTPPKTRVRFDVPTDGDDESNDNDDDDDTRPSPGNGKPQTKKRNARRRLKRAMERTARQTEATEVNGQDSDAPSEEPTTQQPNGTTKSKTKTKAIPWQDRIRYRAVECWDEGVAMGDPPFPFVQRWGEMKAAGDKKKQANGSRKKQVDKDDTTSEENTSDSSSDSSDSDSSDDEDFVPDDEDSDDEDAVNDKPLPNGHPNGTTITTPDDDLPPLPSDVSSLPPLQHTADAVPGTVLAWGKWALSEKTAWQPAVVTVTGVVLAVNDDNVLKVRLAARDRDRPEKTYDAETGERVYGKFEVPWEGDDEEEADEEEDNGEMDVPFSEMMEPRILQAVED